MNTGAAPAPDAVRVDQLGYRSGQPKLAFLVSPEAQPQAWTLLQGGTVVTEGRTVVLGEDALSGDHLHRIDFSSFDQQAKDLTLHVGPTSSVPFQISGDLYSGLFVDAARYFYLNRSGVPLEMPFAGRPELARPAGHLSDAQVTCFPGSDCSYTRDASGGWYDAGDYGKYVVNGGLTVWLLLNTFEVAPAKQRAWFRDGQLNLPESGNGSPDLLDEARFELEFLLRMQVPAGDPLAGMVHHKLHDAKWTGLGSPPQTQSEVPRYLHPPSTAATLNLAAVGAQAARIFRKLDPKFADRCLAAARRAFDAAVAHPDRLAPVDSHTGGGPYNDKLVGDDFYWATAELFATTGEATYGRRLRAAPEFTHLSQGATDGSSSFDWATTDALGTISLLQNSQKLSAPERAALQAEIVRHADSYLQAAAEGYHVPLKTIEGHFGWGTNSAIASNAIMLALAHELTGRPEYLTAVHETMHFFLGRNAVGKSFITGYGARRAEHPHHRFWAKSVNAAMPDAPPGALVGGPNSRLQDPLMKEQQKTCKPLKCYLDRAEAFSVNEVAINWNAGLVWLSAYLARQDT